MLANRVVNAIIQTWTDQSAFFTGSMRLFCGKKQAGSIRKFSTEGMRARILVMALVPMLRVGTHSGDAPRRGQSPLRRESRAAERPDVRSHAERGNEIRRGIGPMP